MIHALRNSCDLCKDASILYPSSLASSKFGLREPGDCDGSGGAKASLLPAYLARTPAAYAPGSSHKSIVFENQFWFFIKSFCFSTVLAHVCDCLTVYSLMQWGPTIYQVSTQNPSESFECLFLHQSRRAFYNASNQNRQSVPDTQTNAHQEKFGCTPTEVGRYIAVPNLMHWLAQFFSAALEKAAAQRGVPPLTIRTSDTAHSLLGKLAGGFLSVTSLVVFFGETAAG